MNDLNLDWFHDDGINLPMLNDVPRNVFYDKILSAHVQNKRCCDIGFGTGFLSLLAIKHGAKHVVAYEKDTSRFKLGQYIIEALGLKNKIDLRNARATTDIIAKENHDIVFHEIVHQSIWGEGVWWIRPKKEGITYVPGRLFFELYAQEISDSTAHGFLNAGDVDHFNPGVDIDHRFINLINHLILGNQSQNIVDATSHNQLLQTQWNTMHKDWSWDPIKVFQQSKKKLLAGYSVDYNTFETTFFDSHGIRRVNLSCDQCELTVDTEEYRNKNILLQPRFGLEHGQDRLFLDACRGWGSESPWIFIRPENKFVFLQKFFEHKFHLSKI